MDADADGREPTGWMLRIRGRRGEVVPRPGEKIDLNQFYYVEAGPFSVPIPRGFRIGQRGWKRLRNGAGGYWRAAAAWRPTPYTRSRSASSSSYGGS